MNDYPIHAGSMLFTMVDPEQGYEVEYNRWYERDHFYAGCMIGPWLFAGKRWVATRELKDLRFPRVDTPVASPVEKGSYLAVYYVLEGKHGEHFAWAADQVVDLYSNNRGFMHRVHAHSVQGAVELKGTAINTTRSFTVEIEGVDKPALVADWVTRIVFDS